MGVGVGALFHETGETRVYKRSIGWRIKEIGQL